MAFKYEKKESYTQQELDSILEQHDGFVKKQFKEYVSPEDYSKVVEELKPLRSEKRNSHVKSLVKGITSDNKLDKLIKYSDIKDDDDDETVINKANKLAKEDDYFKVNSGVPIEIKKEIKKEVKQPEKKYKFMK